MTAATTTDGTKGLDAVLLSAWSVYRARFDRQSTRCAIHPVPSGPQYCILDAAVAIYGSAHGTFRHGTRY